jgi:hypothetical protein
MVDLLDVSIIIACLQGCAGPAHGGNSLVISISNFPLFADSALGRCMVVCACDTYRQPSLSGPGARLGRRPWCAYALYGFDE